MEKQKQEFVEKMIKKDRRKGSSEKPTQVPLPKPFESTEKIDSTESMTEDFVESEKTVFEEEKTPEIGNDVDEGTKYLFNLSKTKKTHVRAPRLIDNKKPTSFRKVSLPKISTPSSDFKIEGFNIEKTAETIAEKIKLETEIEHGRVETDVNKWTLFAEKSKEENAIHLDLLYLMSAVPKDVNSVRHGSYTKDHLWNAVKSNFRRSYDISDAQLDSFGDKLFSEIRTQMKTNPLYLHEIEDLIYRICKNNINQNTFEVINSMTMDEKKIVLISILKPLESWEIDDWLNNFNKYFKECFNDDVTIDVFETLEKSTLLLKGGAHDQTRYKMVSYLPNISNELKENMRKSIGIDLSQIEDAINNIEEEIKLEEEVERGRVETDTEKWKDAINRLKEEDFILVDMLYTVASTNRYKTNVGRGYYQINHLWEAVKENMKLRYELTDEDFFRYKEILYSHIQKGLKTNLLHLFRNEKMIYELIKDDLINHILNNVKNMCDIDKKAILCYLIGSFDFYWDNMHEEFNKRYKICFGVDYIGDIKKTLTKADILVYSIYITSDGTYRGAKYNRPDSFPEISKHIKKCIVENLKLDLTDLERKLSEAINEIEIEKGEEERTEIQEDVETISTESTMDARQGDLDLFEEFIMESSPGNFPRSISNDKPVVILLSKSNDDDYGTAVQVFARELFKELAGGLPSGKIWSEHDHGIERDLQADNHIEFIDNTNTKYFEPNSSNFKTEKSVNWENLGYRLQELIHQGFGFIIFQIQEEVIDDFKEKIEELTGDKKPQIIVLHPQFEGSGKLISSSDGKSVENLIEIKKEISKALWGFVNPVNDDRWQRGTTFDNFFSACESKFDEKLKEIGTSSITIERKKFMPEVLVKASEDESNIHYLMKVFVYKYLIEMKNYLKESIKTEEEFYGVYPDIKANDTVIEIETLFGTGRPINKITHTISKYSNKNVEVWLVIKNIDVFFYYPKLMQLKENAKDQYNINLKIFTLDVENNDLVNLKDVKNRIRLPEVISE